MFQEADDVDRDADPADAWPQMESWLQSRVSYELLANYGAAAQPRRRAERDVGRALPPGVRARSSTSWRSTTPTPRLSGARVEHKIELEKMKVGKQAMVALKSAYGGALMFTMLGSMAGIALGPISIGIGLVMGHKGLRDEKKRQLSQRRTQAKQRHPPLLRRGELRDGQGLPRHAAAHPAAAARPLQRRWPRSSAGPTRRRWRPRPTRSSATQAERDTRLRTSTPS